MSAYVCSDLHINTIVSWAAKIGASFYFGTSRENVRGNEKRIAGLLYTANVESVNDRYNEDAASDTFKFKHVITDGPIVNLLSLCNGFDYQACEVNNYDQTIGWAIIHGIKEAAIRKLPGYGDASWSI